MNDELKVDLVDVVFVMLCDGVFDVVFDVVGGG